MNSNVSVIIPAYNVADTIAQTIESLLSQTFKDWEAIVVDDGATDQTVNIVKKYLEKDERIRLVSQSNQGLAGARNTGIKFARNEWLLFLDADDWISGNYLERMTGTLTENPDFDAVHCGWNTVAPNGMLLGDKYAAAQSDMFPSFVRTCAFVVHACIIRKELVNLAGGFDTGFTVCEDWDFWQRISRAGARFVAIREVHAFYRMSPNSLSKKVKLSLINSLKIIDQGHSYDPRVPLAVPEYINGMKPEHLNMEKLYCVTWFAGLYIGQGKNARLPPKLLDKDCTSNLGPNIIAEYIFEAICFSSCQAQEEWQNLWPKTNKHVKEFLIVLEHQSKTKGLLVSTLVILERRILQHTIVTDPLIIDTTYAVRVEITASIPDIYPPATIERLIVKVEMEGAGLGIIELPVCGKVVPGWIVKNSIAKKFAWQILKRFFEYSIYSEKLSIASNHTDYAAISETLHNQMGWTEFLRQLWGYNDWPANDFYDAELSKAIDSVTVVDPVSPVIEISEPIPDVEINLSKLIAMVTIGGANIGCILLPVKNNVVRAQTLRAEITKAGGFELCIVCVREALIGRPLSEPGTIRDRLKQAASKRTTLIQNFESKNSPSFFWFRPDNYDDIDIRKEK